MYLLRLASRPWKAAPFVQFFSVLSVAFLLVLGAVLVWLEQGMNPTVTKLQNEEVITAYLRPELEQNGEKELVDSIKVAAGAHAEVQFVSSDRFLEEVGNSYPDLGKELGELGAEAKNLVPRYVSVTGLLNSNSLDAIKQVRGVEAVETSRGRHQQMLSAYYTLKWVVRVFIGGVALAIFVALILLTKANALLQSDAIRLLKFWGASPVMLRLPSLFNGFLTGLLGGIIAIPLWQLGMLWFFNIVGQLSSQFGELALPPQADTALLLVLVGSGIGTLSGLVGKQIQEL